MKINRKPTGCHVPTVVQWRRNWAVGVMNQDRIPLHLMCSVLQCEEVVDQNSDWLSSSPSLSPSCFKTPDLMITPIWLFLPNGHCRGVLATRVESPCHTFGTSSASVTPLFNADVPSAYPVHSWNWAPARDRQMTAGSKLGIKEK